VAITPQNAKVLQNLPMLKSGHIKLSLSLRGSAGIATALIKLTLIEAKRRYFESIVSQHEGKDSET